MLWIQPAIYIAVYWLEKAAQADFCNPLYVGFKIETEKEWQKYRYLFLESDMNMEEYGKARAEKTEDKKVDILPSFLNEVI